LSAAFTFAFASFYSSLPLSADGMWETLDSRRRPKLGRTVD
jgi:hypothetical protein